MNNFSTIFYNKEPRLRAGWRILGNLLLLAASAIPLSIPITLFSRAGKPGTLITTGLIAAAVSVSVYFSRRWFDRRSFKSLGLNWDRQAVRDLLAGFVIAAAIMVLIFLTELALGWIRVDGFLWQRRLWGTILGDLALGFLIYLAIGWYEELLARGYWLQNLVEGIDVAWGVIFSSSMFSLMHATDKNVSQIAIIWLIVMGSFLAYGYLATHALWLPMGIHVGWNFFKGPVLGFPINGTPGNGLIIQRTTGDPLFTGGTFGPEAGLILIIGLALGAIAIFIYTRNRQKTVPAPSLG